MTTKKSCGERPIANDTNDDEPRITTGNARISSWHTETDLPVLRPKSLDPRYTETPDDDPRPDPSRSVRSVARRRSCSRLAAEVGPRSSVDPRPDPSRSVRSVAHRRF